MLARVCENQRTYRTTAESSSLREYRIQKNVPV